MSLWCTELTLNSMLLGLVDINRGTFQGHSMSLLPFAIILFPLTVLATLLRNTTMHGL